MAPSSEQALRTRARHRCEYCHFPEAYAEIPFQRDHVIAQKHGGPTDLENLALACCFCNRYKGPNLSGMDPETQQVTALFHPRRDQWEEHFGWNGPKIIGRTATGRATIQTLRLNRTDAIAVRSLLMREGVYPLS